MYSDGPFCPVLFAHSRDGLQTYTNRGLLTCLPPRTLVNTITTVHDDREFNARFVATEFRRPFVGRFINVWEH